MREKLFFKKSVVFIWLISYVVVFAIPVIGSVMFFFSAQNKSLRQNENANVLLLQQSVDSLDSLLIEAERISSVLELNIDVYEYTYLSAENRMMKLNKLQRLKNVLISNTVNMSKEMAVSLYLKDVDMFLTINGAYTREEYYEYFIGKAMPYEEWCEIALDVEDSKFFKSVYAFDERNAKDAIVYHKQIPFSGNSENRISLYMIYNVGMYVNGFNQIPFVRDSGVEIIDTNGEKLFTYNVPSDVKSDRDSGKSDQNTSVYTVMAGSRSYSVISIYSKISGWEFVHYIPTENFLSDYRQGLYTFIFVMVCVLLVGSAVIYFLLQRNYLPVRNMLQEYEIEETGQGNEFTLIHDVLTKNIDEKMQLLTTLDKQKSVVQKSYLTRLLTGDIKHGSNVSELLQDINIEFMPNWAYIVVMITVENVDDFFEGETQMGSFERKQLVNFMFENVLGDLIENSYTAYIVPYEDSIFCIYGAEEVSEQSVTEMIKYAQNVFDTNFNIQFSAAVSKVNYGYEGIAEGYNQAIETIEYRLFSRDSGVVLYSDEVKSDSGGYDMIEMDEVFFAGLLEKGKADSAKEYLNRIFCSAPQGEGMSPRRIKCLLYETVNVLLHSITDIYRSADKAAKLQEELLAAIETKQSVEKYCKTFFDIIDSICEDTGSLAKNQSLTEQVKEYIVEHYYNENLNISMLAEVFHLSGGYLSNMFKKEENIGILDFIGMVRITKTKELLRETCMTLEDIYPQVGFTNKSTFIRVFKKVTGMTPMQYRAAGK